MGRRAAFHTLGCKVNAYETEAMQEMLEQATYSFAMANAKESVKAISKYTISSNNDGGVLEAIDWLINKEKMFQD